MSQGQLLSYSDVYFANLSKSESEKKLNPKIFVKINLRVHKYKIMYTRKIFFRFSFLHLPFYFAAVLFKHQSAVIIPLRVI